MFPPYYSRVYCRTCSTLSRWIRNGYENGTSPPVVTWICSGCGAQRYQYADCTNVETMCVTIMEENLRRTGANVDHDEAVSRLVLEAWRLYIGWDPTKGLTFESYAFGILRRRANDIYRQMLGRNGEKPMANALSLDTGGGPGGEGGIWTEQYARLAPDHERTFADAARDMAAARHE